MATGVSFAYVATESDLPATLTTGKIYVVEDTGKMYVNFTGTTVQIGGSNYTHPSYTARTGKPTGNASPDFGETFTVSQITSDATGHVTGATDRTIKIPSKVATTSSAGLMSASDKNNLNTSYNFVNDSGLSVNASGNVIQTGAYESNTIPTISLSDLALDISGTGTTATYTYTADTTGTVTVSSTDTGVATATVSGTTVTVTSVGEGLCGIVLSFAASGNYAPATKTMSVSVDI